MARYDVPEDGDTPKPASGPSLPFLDSMAGADNDIEALLKKLEEQIKQPVGEEPETNYFKRGMAAASDALMNAARIYAGGAPGGNEALSAKRADEAQEQADYEARISGNRQAGVEITKFRLTDAMKRRDAAEAEKKRAADAAQAEADIRERQRLDDMRADQQDGLAEISNMFDKLPGFALPPGEDLSKMTRSRALTIKAEFLKGAKLDPQMGFNEAMDALNKLMEDQQVDTATIQLPGGGSITGRKPVEKPSEGDPTKIPATPTTARQASGAGVWQTGMTEDEARGAIAAKKAENEAEREKRLNKMTARGTRVRDEIIKLRDLNRVANEALAFQASSGNELGGWFGGMPGSEYVLAMHDWYSGEESLKQRVKYAGLLSRVKTHELFGEGGKNLTDTEVSVLWDKVPDITDHEIKQIENLRDIIRESAKMIEERKRFAGLTDEDMDALWSAGMPESASPSPIPQGARKVGELPYATGN